MSAPHPLSRRLFLKQASALSSLGVAAPWALNLAAMGAASAQTASDYKAIVCVFLQGGNDAFNTVLPTDAASWSAYQAVRNQAPQSIALLRDVAPDKSQGQGSPAWLGGVLPLSPLGGATGRGVSLHPLLKNVRGLFNDSRRLAIVPNVGPLVERLSKDQYNKGLGRKPSKLFSHNDQQNTWQAFAPEGATVGWGGRMADMLAASNGSSLFTAVSASGNAVFLSGQSVRQYQMASQGAVRLGTESDAQGLSRTYGSLKVGAALEHIVRAPHDTHAFAQDLATAAGRSMDAEMALRNAMPGAGAAPFGPASLLQYDTLSGGKSLNTLAQQLQTVARTIAARNALGVKRQVFFVALNGFDTHDGQNQKHADLMARLDHALSYFDTVLNAMGVAGQVTTFTASDFGRTFTSNGDGADHGWGAHHFVMGGAVAGGRVCGDFPMLATKNKSNNDFDGSADQLTNGVLLPRISVDQYGATLARWFGLSDTQLRDVFPNLGNFSDAMNLGFMKA